MRFIPTKVHGVLDYLYVLALFLIPGFLHFKTNSTASYVMYVVSAAVLVYSLFTKYELGLFKSIPMKTHLLFDLIGGIFLAASPWIFHFADEVYVPHLFFGLFAIAAALFSQITSPQIKQSSNIV